MTTWLSDCCGRPPRGEVDVRTLDRDGNPREQPYAVGWCSKCEEATTFRPEPPKCERCGGTGTVHTPAKQKWTASSDIMDCPDCKGEGIA